MTPLSVLTFWATDLAYCALFVILPVYVGIQAWRKGRKAAAIFAYLSVVIPFAGLPAGVIVFLVCRLWQPNLNVSPRLQSFFGCGTGFFGATDRNTDGSFLTTEWFGIFLIPLVPIQSYRVSFAGSSTSFSGAVRSQTKQYYIYSKEKLKPCHIARSYALLAGFGLTFLGLMGVFSNGASYVTFSGGQITALCAVMAAFLVLAVRFWRAK